jgi:hypothetical protein
VAQQIGLGGLTDWTRPLLGPEEERLLVSIIATQRLAGAFGVNRAPKHVAEPLL